MKKNVGGIDKTLRIIIGLVLISLVFVGPKSPWGWIGLLPLLTGIFDICLLYIPLKISTAKEKKSEG